MDLTLKFESEFDQNDFSNWLTNVGFSLYLEDSASSVNNLERTGDGTFFVTTQPEPEVTELVVTEGNDTWAEVRTEVADVVSTSDLVENEELGSVTTMFPEKNDEENTEEDEL